MQKVNTTKNVWIQKDEDAVKLTPVASTSQEKTLSTADTSVTKEAIEDQNIVTASKVSEISHSVNNGESNLMTNLINSLSCAICSQLILDAAICPCSHGFCRACIETYHRTRNLLHHACPICNIKPIPAKKPPIKAHSAQIRLPDSDDEEDNEPVKGTIKATSSTPNIHKIESQNKGSMACYFRSCQLDSIVSFIVDASGPVAFQVLKIINFNKLFTKLDYM